MITLQLQIPPEWIPIAERLVTAFERLATPVHVAPPVEPPPAAPVAPEQAAAEPFGKPVWSPERDAVLTELYPAGAPRSVLVDRVNALPGPKIDADRISIRAAKLGLRRPTPADSAPPAPSIEAPAEPTQAEPVDTPAPMWSTERDALLARLYPANVTPGDIAEQISALPGPAVSPERVSLRASSLCLRRPQPIPWPAGPTPAAPAETALSLAMREGLQRSRARAEASKLAPVVTDVETARHWAGQRGIVGRDFDLDRINRKRAELGQPPFAIARRDVGAGRSA